MCLSHVRVIPSMPRFRRYHGRSGFRRYKGYGTYTGYGAYYKKRKYSGSKYSKYKKRRTNSGNVVDPVLMDIISVPPVPQEIRIPPSKALYIPPPQAETLGEKLMSLAQSFFGVSATVLPLLAMVIRAYIGSGAFDAVTSATRFLQTGKWAPILSEAVNVVKRAVGMNAPPPLASLIESSPMIPSGIDINNIDDISQYFDELRPDFFEGSVYGSADTWNRARRGFVESYNPNRSFDWRNVVD